jgi:hypothetical protein
MQMVEAPVVADLSLGVVVAKGTAERQKEGKTEGEIERDVERGVSIGIGSVDESSNR